MNFLLIRIIPFNTNTISQTHFDIFILHQYNSLQSRMTLLVPLFFNESHEFQISRSFYVSSFFFLFFFCSLTLCKFTNKILVAYQLDILTAPIIRFYNLRPKITSFFTHQTHTNTKAKRQKCPLLYQIRMRLFPNLSSPNAFVPHFHKLQCNDCLKDEAILGQIR